ncbi:hypothetical protein MXC99_00745 [Thauera aromatica]|uniref:hypothetical protein n=1 Tax=Thauera aromatica TaxID=59405 RepID=UPI001FFD83E5|nr:hypothetical protein [Thauera aromatica]MCK2086724.1 hypothetical protein [Thauera aromatica]
MACLHFHPHLAFARDHVHAAHHAAQQFASARRIGGEGRLQLAEQLAVALQGVIEDSGGSVF